MRVCKKLGWRARTRKETKEIVDVMRRFGEPGDGDIVLVKNYLSALRDELEEKDKVRVPGIGTFSWVKRDYRMPTGTAVPARVLTFRRCGRFKYKGDPNGKHS